MGGKHQQLSTSALGYGANESKVKEDEENRGDGFTLAAGQRSGEIQVHLVSIPKAIPAVRGQMEQRGRCARKTKGRNWFFSRRRLGETATTTKREGE